jgi:hypothetical protein
VEQVARRRPLAARASKLGGVGEMEKKREKENWNWKIYKKALS